MTYLSEIERIRAQINPMQPIPTDIDPHLGRLDGIRAVLFDVYGTLIVSAAGELVPEGENAADAFCEALDAMGLSSPVQSAIDGSNLIKAVIEERKNNARIAHVEFPEIDIIEVWRAVLADLGISCTEGDLRGLALEYELRVNPVWPMPGLPEVLAEITARGLALGIVSNAQFYTPLVLEAFLGKPLDELGFDRACCAFSYRLLEGKPSTRIYEKALEGLERNHGISPGEVLFVGNDMRNDIRPASLTGCRTALFAGDARSLRLRKDDPCCADVVPDLVVTDLRQISEQVLPL